MPLNPETRRHDIKMITKIFLSNDLSNGRTEKDVIAACRAENLLSYYTHRHDMVGSFELDNFPHSGLFVKSGLNKFKCYSDASNSPSDTLKILIENNKN